MKRLIFLKYPNRRWYNMQVHLQRKQMQKKWILNFVNVDSTVLMNIKLQTNVSFYHVSLDENFMITAGFLVASKHGVQEFGKLGPVFPSLWL